MITCASPEYLKRAGFPRTPADLDHHACAALLTGSANVLDEWQFVKSDKRETIKFTPKLIADGEALREAALAGCGIVRNLTFNVADEIAVRGSIAGSARLGMSGPFPIVAIYKSRDRRLSRVNAFLRHLAHAFQRYNDAPARA